MGLRFRKRIKVTPGLTFNLSWSGKKGIKTSSTIGAPGANVNVGTKKDGSVGIKHGTLGIPGSGLSYHESLDDSISKKADSTEHKDSIAIESNEPFKETTEEDKLGNSTCSPRELTSRDYGLAALHGFAHSRTINWMINFVILGGLTYLNR